MPDNAPVVDAGQGNAPVPRVQGTPREVADLPDDHPAFHGGQNFGLMQRKRAMLDRRARGLPDHPTAEEKAGKAAAVAAAKAKQ